MSVDAPTSLAVGRTSVELVPICEASFMADCFADIIIRKGLVARTVIPKITHQSRSECGVLASILSWKDLRGGFFSQAI